MIKKCILSIVTVSERVFSIGQSYVTPFNLPELVELILRDEQVRVTPVRV